MRRFGGVAVELGRTVSYGKYTDNYYYNFYYNYYQTICGGSIERQMSSLHITHTRIENMQMHDEVVYICIKS